MGIPPSAPLLLLSPHDPRQSRWARAGAPFLIPIHGAQRRPAGGGAPRSWATQKRGRCHWQRPLEVPTII